jgi:hypothetical protein
MLHPQALGYTLWFSSFLLKSNIFPFSASILTFSTQNHLILTSFTHFDTTHFFYKKLYIAIISQALVSFKKYMSPPLPYFKVNICPFSFPTSPQYFSLIYDPFADPIISLPLPRYFSFRLPHLNIPTGPPSDELDKNIQRTS